MKNRQKCNYSNIQSDEEWKSKSRRFKLEMNQIADIGSE